MVIAESGQGNLAAGTYSPDDIVSDAREHVWAHNLSWADVAENEAQRIFARGEGSKLWDIQGREFIDGLSAAAADYEVPEAA